MNVFLVIEVGMKLESTTKSDQDRLRRPILSILVPLLVGLVLNQQDGGFRWLKLKSNIGYETKSGARTLMRPQNLMNYNQFLTSYPRLETNSILNHSSRHLLFNADLLTVCKHNLAYLLNSSQTYLMRQSPFKSDRTPLEQMDILNQLDSFDLDKIREQLQGAALSGPTSLDNPVSGGAKLEEGNPVNRWLTRFVKGDSYFEIPNYPLDEQPDKNKITHIDSDLRGCVGDIRDQKKCGACYAFSWTSYAEWHYCRQAGKKINFSEQHIVDCGHLARLNGCIEGYLLDVRDFSHTFGFNLEQDYPYLGKKGQCKNSMGSVQVKTVDFTRIIVNREEWEQVLDEQPILVEASLPRDIMSYKRGVHPGDNCDRLFAHGMLLVGYGRQEGVPYWLLKNSMGVYWGENGYLRLSRDAPMTRCFKTGFISKFKFKDIDDQSYYEFYDNLKFKPTVQPELRIVMKKKDVLNSGQT